MSVRYVFRKVNEWLQEQAVLYRVLIGIVASYASCLAVLITGNMLLVALAHIVDRYFYTGFYAAVQQDSGFTHWGDFFGTFLLGLVLVLVQAYLTTWVLHGLGLGYLVEIGRVGFGRKPGNSTARRLALDRVTYAVLISQLVVAWLLCLFTHGTLIFGLFTHGTLL